MDRFEKNKEFVIEMLKKNSYIAMFDMEIMEFSKEKMLVKVPIRESILNPYKTVHGGALYSIADIVGGSLVNSLGRLCTTVSGNLNYLRPVGSGEYFFCEAKLIKDGINIAVVNIDIMNKKHEIMNNGSFTFYKSDKMLNLA